jgi:hypothetical protein
MRTLQRDGVLPLAPARAFSLWECVQRCVRVVQALDCVPSRLSWVDEFAPQPPLPERVSGDEGALTACLHNMLITCAPHARACMDATRAHAGRCDASISVRCTAALCARAPRPPHSQPCCGCRPASR